MGICGILGFAFGLTGGILSLERKRFAISIFGTSFVLVSGFVTIIGFASAAAYGAEMAEVLFGLPPILLSILGIIFLGVSKGEFT